MKTTQRQAVHTRESTTTDAAAPRDGSGAMFDRIARHYDLVNRCISLGLDQRWRRRLIDALGPLTTQSVLDVATGTGDVALALLARAPEARVVGLDPSARMLERAARKRRKARARNLRLVRGDAEALPFGDACFDAVTISFGIRNVPGRLQALREMRRVLRPGAPLAVLELAWPRRGVLSPFARAFIRRAVPAVGALFGGDQEYRYLERSIAAFPESERFCDLMREVGFSEVRARTLAPGVVTLFTGRRRDTRRNR